MSGQSEQLARALEQQDEHASSHWAFAATCGTCVAVRRKAEAVATALLPIVEQMSNERAAEAWEHGVAQERLHQQRVTSYTHWSGISAGPPQPLVNPYRATAAAEGREDGGRG